MPDSKQLIKEFKLNDRRNTIVWVYQGSKGDNPDLDILVKYKDDFAKTKNGRTPKHIDWAVDIIIKKEHDRELTLEFVKYLLNVYNKIERFRGKAEQQRCELIYTKSDELKRFETLSRYGQFSVDFLGCVMELLSREEKTGSDKAHMFKDVLTALYETEDIFSITNAASFRGRG